MACRATEIEPVGAFDGRQMHLSNIGTAPYSIAERNMIQLMDTTSDPDRYLRVHRPANVPDFPCALAVSGDTASLPRLAAPSRLTWRPDSPLCRPRRPPSPCPCWLFLSTRIRLPFRCHAHWSALISPSLSSCLAHCKKVCVLLVHCRRVASESSSRSNKQRGGMGLCGRVFFFGSPQ